MKEVKINDKTYELIKDIKDGFDNDAVSELLTDYFETFDYIVGDWAYGKLRLKGFNDKKNKSYKEINDVSGIDSYIEKNCAYGCRWFILKNNLVENNKKD